MGPGVRSQAMLKTSETVFSNTEPPADKYHIDMFLGIVYRNGRNSVVVALDMVTSRDLVQRDILVGNQDVEGSTIHLFTLVGAEGTLDPK